MPALAHKQDAGNASIADILDRAADLIEPSGAWLQGALKAGDNCFCAMGAIIEESNDWAAVEWLNDQLPDDPDHNLEPVAQFNDAKSRTQAEVVAMLREKAKLAREQSK